MDTSADDQNFDSLSSALAAFDFLANADRERAARLWNHSAEMHNVAFQSAALVVATANAGVAALLLGDAHDARERLLRAASALSQSSQEQGVASLRGTSSGYHFRLAALHGDAFEAASASRGKELRELMSMVIAHHIAALDGNAGSQTARSAMSVALENVFGRASVEARLSRATTPSDIADCYAARAGKLRTILRHWRPRAVLTPEISIAALAIWPFEMRHLSAAVSTNVALAKEPS